MPGKGKSMNKKTIGILAGMGPRSTTPFLEMILDQCQKQYGAKYDMEYPQIMIYSLPTPFYIDREIDHEHMKNIVIEGLRRLESTGVDFIAMPCNSAHIYFEDLKQSINIPLLNIVDETIENLPSEKQRVAVFATEGTIRSGIYQNGIASSGHEFAIRPEWQNKVNNIIQMIKLKENKDQILKHWKWLLDEVKQSGVDTLILGCTDLSLLGKEAEDMSIVDSSDSLAEKVIKYWFMD